MKNIIAIIVFTIACNACFAQDKENNLTKLHLTGKVKEVTAHYFENTDKADTLKPHAKEIFRFDTTGNEIEEINCDTDRVIISIFTYNQKAQITEIMEYDTSRTDTMKTILKYNDKGYLIEKEDLIDPELARISNYKYDDKGRQVEVDLYHKNKPDDTTSRVFFKYDDKGNMIEKDIYLSSFGLFGKRIYKYDSQNLEIYNVWYNGGGRLSDEIKSEYSDYDKQGNWTTKSMIDNVPGDPTKKTIVKRVIIYY